MEILLNTNAPVKHKVFWKGSIKDADSNPIVKVYDITNDPAVTPGIDPGQLLTTWTSEKSETDFGTYYVYPPLTYTSRSRQLRLVWEYFVEGQGVKKEHDLFVVVPYTDLAQAIDSLGIGTDPSDPNYKTYSELLDAERWARKVIENYTGQGFYLYNDLNVVYGAGTDILPLPFKLSQLHELYENDILLIDTINDIYNIPYSIKESESGFGIRVDRSNLIDNIVYTANGMVPPSINQNDGGTFRKGAVYKIQGIYGWDKVPDEVDLACIELMKDYFSKDRSWRNKYINSVQSFDWNFKYSNESYRGTGNVFADQILLPYVLNQMVVI